MSKVDLLKNVFSRHFGHNLNLSVFRSPGRVNLIGEHTDYNEGFVFPGAIDRQIIAIASPRSDDTIRAWSEDLQELGTFQISSITKGERHWTDYIKGVAKEFTEIKKGGIGYDIVFQSDLPAESGLSSSAAFEMINAFVLAKFNNMMMSPVEMALLCQRAENSFVGLNCGIMDQFAIALGKKDSALYLDTKTLEYEVVNFNLASYSIVIGNTKKPRTLASSAYNTRRAECGEAVRVFSEKVKPVSSLRYLTLEQLETIQSELSETVYRRAKHVISENKRVQDSVKALKTNNIKLFGELMIASHNSLRDDYEVSCTELDVMVSEAIKTKGCAGSRMTGAGFGGCTVSLVEKDHVEDFIKIVGKAYQEKTKIVPEFYVTGLSDGTGLI